MTPASCIVQCTIIILLKNRPVKKKSLQRNINISALAGRNFRFVSGRYAPYSAPPPLLPKAAIMEIRAYAVPDAKSPGIAPRKNAA
jgi:hypothetical protein